ncbi:MAG TPA: tetratricopeptide repeat protein [Hyphomonadaceae bacterium]|jgi:tetratricopeptide (TPR) repeat protein|nr:tetratricopeptide repeat protein [Hyphomonadaceae bacterium]
MSAPAVPAELVERCDRLVALLDSDPGNLSLLSATAEAALGCNRPDLAQQVLDRYAKDGPLPEREAGLAGLAAMQAGDFDAAIVHFRPLFEKHPGDLALRFNLAWSLAMKQTFEEAIELLDSATADALPQAAALKVQLLHNEGEFEDAFALGKELLTKHPGNRTLLASMSVLALDVEDTDVARECADQAGDHPDAQTTLGILALSTQDMASARAHFDKAIAVSPNAPRTLLGKGLVDLVAGDAPSAARGMEQGAKVFGSHIGSWIAAGWAHLLANDLAASRRCFEAAYNLDDAFAESHGSLAVLDLIEGRVDQAKRRTEVALRLDRESFSAAFAKACLAAGAGRPDVAQQILQSAMTTPIGRGGYKIADALARLSFSH